MHESPVDEKKTPITVLACLPYKDSNAIGKAAELQIASEQQTAFRKLRV